METSCGGHEKKQETTIASSDRTIPTPRPEELLAERILREFGIDEDLNYTEEPTHHRSAERTVTDSRVLKAIPPGHGAIALYKDLAPKVGKILDHLPEYAFTIFLEPLDQTSTADAKARAQQHLVSAKNNPDKLLDLEEVVAYVWLPSGIPQDIEKELRQNIEACCAPVPVIVAYGIRSHFGADLGDFWGTAEKPENHFFLSQIYPGAAIKGKLFGTVGGIVTDGSKRYAVTCGHVLHSREKATVQSMAIKDHPKIASRIDDIRKEWLVDLKSALVRARESGEARDQALRELHTLTQGEGFFRWQLERAKELSEIEESEADAILQIGSGVARVVRWIKDGTMHVSP